ncbi:Transposase [Mariniphaga anaerophila]|uniref:Transposase n=1 Tax=Mariniphaga anaerophila TaxID=1484053 RepID=A0A1M5FKS9_9BACT|nr:IS66 family transposase [Mariniphaga anaerophila]SHF92103.1 Transposase [Mariniphaga anaerophila]
MSQNTDNEKLIQQLLQERDEMYCELSRLRQADDGYLEVLKAQNTEQEALINKQKARLQKQEEQLNKMADQLAWYRRRFWKASSERYIPSDPNQRKIDFDGLDLLPEEENLAQDADKELLAYKRKQPQKQKKKPVRLPLPEDLRREEETIEPEGIDDNWTRIGEEVTEVLEHKPGELYVRRIIRPKYAAKPTQQEQEVPAVQIASLPPLPLPRSNAGASLLAELLINKYQHHLPFHRQITIFKQIGVSLPASTINGWFQGSCDLLRALYFRLREVVIKSDYIQVDESTVPVVNNEKNKTVKAYLWMVRSVMKNLVFFHYDKGSRAQKVVVGLLHGFQGAIQTDGYEAYSIYEQKKGVLLLGCWAHARRKFEESLAEDKAGAGYALAQIAKLYQVETMATEQDMDNMQRAELRKRLAYPIMVAFEKWIVNYYPKVLPKSKMGRALSYTYSLFHRLSRYHLDGRYKIDNNLAENAIRPLALGRKNYLFCGNHDAAENAAVIYSLLGCCKAADVNPREWLTDVLTKIPVYNNDYSLDLADLLPHNWKNS